MWHLEYYQQTSKPLQTKNYSLSGEWVPTGRRKSKLYAAVTHWDPEIVTQPVEQPGCRRWHELFCKTMLCVAFLFYHIIHIRDISWRNCSSKTLELWISRQSSIQKSSWFCGGEWFYYLLLCAKYLRTVVESTRYKTSWTRNSNTK